jgi:aminoglycoside 6'-N-acetyltransferase
MVTRAVSLADFDTALHDSLLRTWLERPHVKQWWSMQRAEDLIAREPDTHAVIEVDGAPVGYLCWEFPPQQDLEEANLTDLPAQLMDIDILIGEQALLGQGIGSEALRQLVNRFRERDDIHFAGMATSVDNRRAKRAYEKAGFRVFREFDDPECGRCYYLTHKTIK